MSNGKKLPPGDYVFMAFLTLGPTSAYEIKKAMTGSVSFFWSAAHSQVYQQASRLLRDGYISERGDEGPRGRRMLALTSKGRSAVKSWLEAPAPLYSVKDESLVKLFFGRGVSPETTAAMLRDQIDKHRAQVAEFEQFEAALAMHDPGDQPPYELLTVKLGIGIERAWIAWLEESLALVAH